MCLETNFQPFRFRNNKEIDVQIDVHVSNLTFLRLYISDILLPHSASLSPNSTVHSLCSKSNQAISTMKSGVLEARENISSSNYMFIAHLHRRGVR